MTLTKIGVLLMKILKIENGIGLFYSFIKKEYIEIDKINRDSLLALVDYVLKNDDSNCDSFEGTTILNKAQEIVYKDISTKLLELIEKRETIINEINSKYKEAEEKYKN